MGELVQGPAGSDVGAFAQEPPLLRQVLEEWNDTRGEFPAELCVHELFEARVDRSPDAEAVVLGADRLTYRELEARANRLANHLRKLGVKPDVLVGLSMERSVDMVVALLGILKAGGAYLPLDVRYPQERLAFMLGDSRVSLVITQERLIERLTQARPFLKLLALDAAGQALAGESAGRPAAGVTPQNLCYVIYTSGSTGRPKGVMVPHRGLVNLAEAQLRTFGATPESRMLQLASWSFDASIFEMLMALDAGATVCLAPQHALVPGEALVEVMRRERVTHVTLSPSVLQALPQDELPDLATIVSAGEACPASLVGRWAEGRRFWNAYGPTEATIWATVADCEDAGRRPSIGRPIQNVRVYVLDADMEPVDVGEPGELYIGGVGVARGYLKRQQLTAERFVPDPFATEAGARLYRTGDLARWLPDGTVDFLGRIDHQVKIRGLRIELGEIEALLNQLPQVGSSLVMAREDEPGEKRLVAYVVPADPAAEPSSAALRTVLQERLPEFMVPSAVVFLAAWPMTPNGKVDRDALPAPENGRAGAAGANGGVRPRTDVEKGLEAIWRELLGVQAVAVHDNLFELGAHSLQIAQIASRVREVFGVELPVKDVFNHPTLAGLANEVENARRTHRRPELPAIERAARGGHLPLSFPQERVWFLNQLAPGNVAYNAQAALRFHGPLDPGVYRRVLTEVVRRHEIFRTTFPAVDGRPVQVVEPPAPVALPVVDLSAVPRVAREPLVERLVREELGRPFDVTRTPLARWTLLRLAAEEWVLVQVEHHFVHDGWSFGVLLQEMRVLYEAFAAGLPSPLPEPEVQYADFAVWQRRWMSGDVLAEHLAFWKQRLAGSPPLLGLPTDRPRPKVQSFRGAAPRIELPGTLYRGLRDLARREGVTLYMIMLAAFKTLLYRYSGQDDLLVGSGVANRRARQLEAMPGMVVNTIVFRTSLAGDPTSRELLARVREAMLEASIYEDLPFEKLVEELAPDRDLARNPLFQVLFSFHDAPVPDLDFGGLTGAVRELHNGSAKADLNIVVVPRAEQRVGMKSTGEEKITLIWEYSTDLFLPATIDRMVEHYVSLLAAAVEDMDRRLSELPLLTAEEERLLARWNETGAELPVAAAGLPVHELVAARAAEAPEALAVAGRGERLSYGELNARANRLAHYLRELGAGPEVPVAVLMERSPAMVVAILAALKAGGAYLPLDPASPPERLAFLLADSGAPVVLTEERLRGRLPAGRHATVTLDAEWDRVASRSAADPEPAARDAASLAYAIYTSGSTGTPKGVEVPHGGLLNLVGWHRQTYDVRAADRATLLAGPAFDASVWEVWPYLTAGASLHVPDEETRTTAGKLLSWLAAEGITICFLPTPLAEAALAEEVPAGLALRALLTGGDKLHRAPGRRLPFSLVNHYGPTENSVVATAAVVPSGTASAAAPPIGRPIANVRVELLDRNLARVPVGVPGELCLAGASLARGYRARPDTTAEKLVPHPFEPGERLYRTGDLARFLPGGELEFLGRIDHQVKVRGFRIELGEVEAVLAGHPGLRESVVLARPAGGEPEAEKRLIAWVVPAPGTVAPAPGDLAELLAKKLPEYMIPSAFVVLDALPLTPNGKVDHRALPEPDATALAHEDEHVEPRTPVEELLAGIWREIIGVSRVGAHDHFFKLGGHSLAATRMLSRLRDAIQIELPLQTLFEAPTLEECAIAVEDLLLAEMGELAESETVAS